MVFGMRVEVHVDPSRAATNVLERNGSAQSPFFHAEEARNSLRALERPLGEHSLVWIHGTARLTRPLQLTAEDSCTHWRGWPDDHAVISGGRVLGGIWVPPVLAGAPWTLQLADATPFNQLWVGGSRAVRAREPEVGSYYLMQRQLPAPQPAGHGFVALAEDVAAVSRSAALAKGEVEAVVYDSWMASRRQVKSVSNATVLLTAPARIEIEPHANSGSRYYLENFAEACDSPGEWFLDRVAGWLLYQPRPGEDPRSLVFEAPVLSGDLLQIEASDVTLSDLSVELVDWSIGGGALPVNTSSGTVQAASFLGEALVHVRNASGVTLRNVTVRRGGAWGVWLDDGAHHNRVTGCAVVDLGAGGVRLGRGRPLPEPPASQTAGSNMVDNSLVAWGGQVFHEGNGILLQHSSHNTLDSNEVAYFSHVGISTGWTWDYTCPTCCDAYEQPSCVGAVNNTLRGNHVHHLGNGDLSDLAGLYFLGVSNGTTASDNVVHDVYPFFTYGHGRVRPHKHTRSHLHPSHTPTLQSDRFPLLVWCTHLLVSCRTVH